MKLVKLFIYACALAFGTSSYAADTYVAASNTVNIPLVKVNSTYYANVQISLGSVVSVGSKDATAPAYDVYNAANWRPDLAQRRLRSHFQSGMEVWWKIPQGTKTFPVEPKLVEKLNFDPGYTFVRIGADILALERDTGKVADAVLNLGKAS